MRLQQVRPRLQRPARCLALVDRNRPATLPRMRAQAGARITARRLSGVRWVRSSTSCNQIPMWRRYTAATHSSKAVSEDAVTGARFVPLRSAGAAWSCDHVRGVGRCKTGAGDAGTGMQPGSPIPCTSRARPITVPSLRQLRLALRGR
ncbi:hypothetical protein XAC3607_2480007 [Xanthomonas citri pv. citri]|nr:hypothetical protein XAC902_720060 [Xanthomonas citri pv. citri]CEE47361.1 hypothetical protein XAC908_780004 [Xanthomonas citri pv. citri]CEH47999.1 hypothetical protein XACLE3_5490004 [Xanthomonas citri pv. citri]CEH57270.1 hypothetical protein XACLG97_7030007 [Xanthomonas citri pv. citri]CEH74295.1 hypothetical protein XACLD7_9490007 [Xanthomonas citri pv. citri]